MECGEEQDPLRALRRAGYDLRALASGFLT
jgi:hypothetical protein